MKNNTKPHDLLIENKGISTDLFYRPPFELKQGEIVVLYLYSGAHFCHTAMYIKDIFTGTIPHENVTTYQSMTFVEYPKESTLGRLFNPMTIDAYLKKYADPKSPFTYKIYEMKEVHPKTKVQTLANNLRKLLSLYATLSKTKQVIFDLQGHNHREFEHFYQAIKEVALQDCSVIILDNTSDLREDCTKYIELQWLGS